MIKVKIKKEGFESEFTVPEGCTVSVNGKIVLIEPEFKKGDILYTPALGGWIYIFNGIRKDGGHFHLGTLSGDYIDFKFGAFLGNVGECRISTDSEKQQLFDALAKEGKVWNAEKLCIEDLKVDPKVGDCIKCYNKETPNNYIYFVCGGFDEDGDPYEKNSYIVDNNKIVEVDSNIGYAIEAYVFEIISKDQFQSELNALGFEYNFENDTISNLKWKPKEGETYFYFNNLLESKQTKFEGLDLDTDFISVKNCFNTKKECESAIAKIKYLLN